MEIGRLILISSIAALGGFLFGYDTGIISGALVFIRQSYTVSTLTQEMIVSAVVLGALVGAISSGQLADHFGRKFILILMAILFIAGTLLSVCAPNVSILIISRLIIGIAIGATSYVVPLFISELAPANQRGALVLLNGIMITSGEAIAFLVDYTLIPSHSWRLMFATGLIPAILFFIGMLIVPTSPRWLILKGQTDKGRSILLKIRHPNDVEQEVSDIIQNIQKQKSNWRELFSRRIRSVLIVGLGLGIFQQFVGINTVMYYGPTIFQAVGFESKSAQILATFGMGLVNAIMSMVAVVIIDKVGRRKMLLTGIFTAGISLSIVSIIFYYHAHTPFFTWCAFVLLVTYIAGYSLSLGSLFWLVISEIYPLHIRGLAMSFVTAIQWGANFIVALTFLSILEWGGPALTFSMYSLMCLTSFVFCYYLVPETRGVSLEHIEENLRQGKRSKELGFVY
jgi:SP family galactose:H+ symporter-like MFS transporter